MEITFTDNYEKKTSYSTDHQMSPILIRSLYVEMPPVTESQALVNILLYPSVTAKFDYRDRVIFMIKQY